MNNHVQDELTGSPAERFQRRKPKTLLPNSIERDVDWKSMLTERTNKTTKHVESTKERKSKDEFKIGDRVILQEQTGRKQWIDVGMIENIRPSRVLDEPFFKIRRSKNTNFRREFGGFCNIYKVVEKKNN